MLHLDCVDKDFGHPRPVSVLRSASLAIGGGQVVCVSGPVGSGKTTLIRLACGDLFADAGRVVVLGHDLARLRRSSLLALRKRVAWIPQELHLLADRSALANVALAAEVAGDSAGRARVAAAEALVAVGLGELEHVPPTALSTGQRRRVCLARGLVTGPRLILADEPTGDLDPAGVFNLVAELERHTARGAAALLTTHDRRLLDAARTRGWRHVRLVGGAVEDVVAPASEEPGVGVIVPFPARHRVGGME